MFGRIKASIPLLLLFAAGQGHADPRSGSRQRVVGALREALTVPGESPYGGRRYRSFLPPSDVDQLLKGNRRGLDRLSLARAGHALVPEFLYPRTILRPQVDGKITPAHLASAVGYTSDGGMFLTHHTQHFTAVDMGSSGEVEITDGLGRRTIRPRTVVELRGRRYALLGRAPIATAHAEENLAAEVFAAAGRHGLLDLLDADGHPCGNCMTAVGDVRAEARRLTAGVHAPTGLPYQVHVVVDGREMTLEEMMPHYEFAVRTHRPGALADLPVKPAAGHTVALAWQGLYEAAVAAREHSFVPRSGTPEVLAAKTDDGTIVTASNCELSYKAAPPLSRIHWALARRGYLFDAVVRMLHIEHEEAVLNGGTTHDNAAVVVDGIPLPSLLEATARAGFPNLRPGDEGWMKVFVRAAE